MKVSTKLYVCFVLLFVVAISLVGNVLRMQKKQELDSVGINLAGRQRMLSQKMTKEILLVQSKDLPAEAVKGTINTFHATLTALARGGKAPLDPEKNVFVDLPAPALGALKEQFKKVEDVWQPFQENATKALEKNDAAALDYIKKQNAVLLVESNKAVSLMDQEAAAKVRDVRNLLQIGAGILTMLFLLTMYIIRKNVHTIFNLLESTAAGLLSSSNSIGTSGRKIATTSKDLADGANNQAASIEETSASLEEMSSMTKQNADNAAQADVLMKEAFHSLQNAHGVMQELTSSMHEINEASQQTSKIIKTIDEIAFQTNLLALNAAVEAARAGEAGAGFAVVAGEVRNLAMRAAEAARNTSHLIAGTVEKVGTGSQLVQRTNDAFSHLTENTRKAAEYVNEISAASREQALGIEQINLAITEVDKVTQASASAADETALTSQDLNEQAGNLHALVSDFAGLLGKKA